MKNLTRIDLQQAIAEEIAKFLEENRSEIVRRAMERVERERKEASGDESET